MSTDWSLLLEDSKSVENVKVVCKDGVVFSHKLVIASSGEFMKNLLNDVPVGDEITIYLPDYDEDTFSNILNSAFVPNLKETVNVFDFVSSPHQELEPEIIKRELLDEETLSDDNTDAPLEEVLKEESKNDLVRMDLQYKSDSRESSQRNNIKKFHASYFSDTEFDDATAEHRIVEFEKQVIENPQSSNEIRTNKRILKQINFEKAKIEVIRGTCTSVRQAAKKYDVSHSTLSCFMKNPLMEYKGRKNTRSLVFSEAEEINLAQRVINMSDGGKTLNYKVIKEVLTKELEHIQLNEPDRFIKVSNQNEKKITDAFVKRFAASNGLLKYVSQEALCGSRRQYECDVCSAKFVFKNSMVFHRKNVHFSFLL